VIIGGDLSDLLIGNLLSLYQVPSILLEQQTVESKFRHPQAHFLNADHGDLASMDARTYWVRKAMPPVDYGTPFDSPTLDRGTSEQVVHPVDRPLQSQTGHQRRTPKRLTAFPNARTITVFVGHLRNTRS
jgi:hypothetical protein